MRNEKRKLASIPLFHPPAKNCVVEKNVATALANV